MNKKLLVGFELCIDDNLNVFNEKDINMRLLNRILNFSQKHFNVNHTIYVENSKIQLFCTTENIEVPLKSRGRDESTKALIKSVKEKYSSLFFQEKYRHVDFEINPIYFAFKEGQFFIYKYGVLTESRELCNTSLWYEYYSKYQYEVDCCHYCNKCKLAKINAG